MAVVMRLNSFHPQTSMKLSHSKAVEIMIICPSKVIVPSSKLRTSASTRFMSTYEDSHP